MKKLIASIAVLLIVTSYLISCEKDDICAEGTPTTPGLVVEFYKKGTSAINPVQNFVSYVPGSTKRDTLKSGSEVILPLRTDQDEVTWALEYNTVSSGGVKSSNTDYFTVKYTRKNSYVSRACGYKTTFTLIGDTQENPNPLLTDPVSPDDLYIKDIVVVTPNIETENEVHVKIYF
jgi:hypothetical protein